MTLLATANEHPMQILLATSLAWIAGYLLSILVGLCRFATKSLIDNEGKLSNCFSINQLVGQNIISKNQAETSVKRKFLTIILNFESWFLSLLVVYDEKTVSSLASQKAGFVIVHA